MVYSVQLSYSSRSGISCKYHVNLISWERKSGNPRGDTISYQVESHGKTGVGSIFHGNYQNSGTQVNLPEEAGGSIAGKGQEYPGFRL